MRWSEGPDSSYEFLRYIKSRTETVVYSVSYAQKRVNLKSSHGVHTKWYAVYHILKMVILVACTV